MRNPFRKKSADKVSIEILEICDAEFQSNLDPDRIHAVHFELQKYSLGEESYLLAWWEYLDSEGKKESGFLSTTQEEWCEGVHKKFIEHLEKTEVKES